jgi:hypothetical protein
MATISGGSWFTVGDQCRLRVQAVGSDEAYMIFGEFPCQHELSFSASALRTFVAKGAAVLAQIEAMAANENTDGLVVAVELSA